MADNHSHGRRAGRRRHALSHRALKLRLPEQRLVMLRIALRVVWLLVGLSSPLGAVTTGTTSISDGAENSSRGSVGSHGPDWGGLCCTASCLPRPGQRTGTAR